MTAYPNGIDVQFISMMVTDGLSRVLLGEGLSFYMCEVILPAYRYANPSG